MSMFVVAGSPDFRKCEHTEQASVSSPGLPRSLTIGASVGAIEGYFPLRTGQFSAARTKAPGKKPCVLSVELPIPLRNGLMLPIAEAKQ
jgi:hypothetical protein